MPNTIQLKRSGTASATPSSLALGELALNYQDGVLFYKNGAGAIVALSTGGGGVADGNKGDITVSSGGTAWAINAGAVVTADIADSAVTDAKIASISASKITSGTVATARLGSGTADGTTFLRGDGTWAVPSGGGGSSADVIHPFLLGGM